MAEEGSRIIELSGLISSIAFGFLIGGIYALMSIGLTLIWGVMDFVNFASGQITMLGMYATYVFAVMIGFDPLIALAMSFALLFLLGLLLQRSVIAHLAGSPKVFQLVVTLALGFIIQNSIIVAFGNEILGIPREQGSLQILSQVLLIGPVRMSYAKLLPLPVAILLTVLLHYFLKRTRIGLGIRAIAQNPSGALLSGVNVKRAYFYTWGISCGFMGIAGALLALFQPLYPSIGADFILVSYLAVVLGGAGSYVGSFVGALIIGVIQSTTSFVFYPAISQVVYLVLFILVLLLIPGGIFPTREVSK